MSKQYTSGYTNEKVSDISARIMHILEKSAEKEEDSIVGLNIAFHSLSKACYRMCRIVGNQTGGGTREAVEMLMRSIADMDNYVRQEKEEEGAA